MIQQSLTKISNQEKRNLCLFVFLSMVVIISKTTFVINVGKMFVACFLFACLSLVSVILIVLAIKSLLIQLKKFKAFLFVLKDMILLRFRSMRFRSLETGFSLVKKSIIRIFFSTKKGIIKAGKYCNTILLLAIKKFIQLFTDIKSFLSGLIENQKLIQWFTRAKPIFHTFYGGALGYLSLGKPAVILNYGREIIQIYSTCWSGFFGPCLGLVCGLIIVLSYLFLGFLYIKHGLEQVKHGNILDKLMCLVTRIGRVTMGILVLHMISKYGGIVIMWNKDWDLICAMVVSCLTGWVLPTPSICCLPMLQTNSSFDQPVTSQAVVARPLAARPVSMPLPFDESVTSQAGVASVPLAEQPVASQAGVVSSSADRGPVIIIGPHTIHDQMGTTRYLHLPFMHQPVPPTRFPLPIHYNYIPHLMSTLHPLFPGQTGIGMPAISWDEPVANQRDLFRDDRPCRLDPFERIVPVDAEEVWFLEKDRIGLIDQQNKLNKPFREAILLTRQDLGLVVPVRPCYADLLSDHRSLKMAAVEGLNKEWTIMQNYDKLIHACAHKERLDTVIKGIEKEIKYLLQYHNRDHPDLLDLYQESHDKQTKLSNFKQGHPDLEDGLSLLRLSQELNNARVETDVSLYKHQQFVRAVIEGKMNSTRLVRPEHVIRIGPIYYPALYDRYPSLQTPMNLRPLMKWEFGVMRQNELNKAIGGGLVSYLIAIQRVR